MWSPTLRKEREGWGTRCSAQRDTRLSVQLMRQKQMKEPSRVTIVATLLLAAMSLAQEKRQEPNYQETAKWIVEKIPEAGRRHSGITTASTVGGERKLEDLTTISYDQVSLDDCTLQFTEVTTVVTDYEGGRDGTTRVIYSAPLAKVKQVDIKHDVTEAQHLAGWYGAPWNSWDVILEVPSAQKQLDQQGQTTKVDSVPSVSIGFGRSTSADTNEDSASRLKKALDHAVELCKKKEPF